jgi:Cu(I)/Ag(I) efflux system membrane protein CusA/SilA
MQRIAVPMIGGIVSSTALTLVVIPALFAITRARDLAASAVRKTNPASNPRFIARD